MRNRQAQDVGATADAGLACRLERLERWLRTTPRQVGVLVAVLMLGTLAIQDAIDEHLWLLFSYAFPVALAGYGLGVKGGVVASLAATAFLYDHAVNTLGRNDVLFVLATRLCGSLAVGGLAALAAATVRAREEFIRSRDRLAQLQQELVAAFAHDLRSPLNAILGYASLLEEESDEGRLPAELKSGLQRIRANAQHVDEMIEEMLSVERVDGATRNAVATFTAEALLGLLRAEFEPTAQSQGQTLEWTIAPETPPFETDQQKLLSVVRNLVGNALKYAQDGRVTVRIGFEATSGMHRVEVIDDGPGIPAQELERVFDRFYRVGGARDRDGFGLGLFIVKRMLEMIGGEIGLESEIGRGSHFTLSVPRLRVEAPPRRTAVGER